MSPVLFFCCVNVVTENEAGRKNAASDSRAWICNRPRPLPAADDPCWVFAARDADFGGTPGECGQLYFCEGEMGVWDQTLAAALVASENAPPQSLSALQH